MTAATNPPGTAALEAELRALLEKATPGEWTKIAPGRDADGFACGVLIAATAPSKSNRIYANPPGGSYPAADQNFIVGAKNALPALLDALAAQREEAARALLSPPLRISVERLQAAFDRSTCFAIGYTNADWQSLVAEINK